MTLELTLNVAIGPLMSSGLIQLATQYDVSIASFNR